MVECKKNEIMPLSNVWVTKVIDDNGQVVASYGIGNRHLQVFLLFWAMVNAFALRVNISMAIVTMTDPTKKNHFDWSVQIQSLILSSYFWGNIVLQIPSGILAARFGGKILLLICFGIDSIVTLILPTLSYYGGWELTCACRVMSGLVQGFLFSSIHHLIGKWVPVEEKGFLGTIVYAGGTLGTALQLMMSGFLADKWGWESIFYASGVGGVVWTIVYSFLGAAQPSTSKMISENERNFIEKSLGRSLSHEDLKTPWKSMFTSLPFWSLTAVYFGFTWGFYTLATLMPSYMSQVLDVDIRSNGVLSALPYIVMFLISLPIGYVADLTLRKKWLSITASRKLSNSIGFYGPAIALIGLSYSPVGNVTVAVILLVCVVGLNAGHFTGFLLVHIDMSPNFAGTMMGITTFFSVISAILAPMTAGWIIHDEKDPAEWRKVFYVASAMYIITNTFFVICGTCKRQVWDEPKG